MSSMPTRHPRRPTLTVASHEPSSRMKKGNGLQAERACAGARSAYSPRPPSALVTTGALLRLRRRGRGGSSIGDEAPCAVRLALPDREIVAVARVLADMDDRVARG